MTCPQCQKHIPAKAVWNTSGLSGVVCPECHASLCPTPISAIIVFALSFGLGDLALVLLSLYYANLGGDVRGTPISSNSAEVCQWFNCDNQGRGGDDTPIWGCSQQGRVCYSVMKGRTTTNVTGLWSTGGVRWRNAAKSPAEETMWFDETVASGMVIWYTFIGAQTGMGEDHRWQAPAARLFHLAGEARPPLRQQAHHRQPGRGDGPADPPVLSAARQRQHAAVYPRRPVLCAARRPLPVRLRA